ncbi:F-box/kelch-repeat protein At3g24760 [Lycium ferocissimum]|uniref:F-box/kelch-repeat protein At3g24760 n=1 Tax=Lycium ferocissimum TaxID=112874 RepID=UPI002814EEF2|nr:F-box/kelch-repeat protein At3g24760 [Lycium ferocissimum]
MEEHICIQKPNSQNDQIIKNWENLCSDITEKIIFYLPIRSIVIASSVCKIWNSIITSNSFTTKISATKKPWFFLCGQNSIFYKNNQAFAYDPDENEWITLPTSTLLSQDFFIGSNGFFFATTSENFSFKPIFKNTWVQTSPLRFSRCNPLVGVYNNGSRFIVVGGVRFVGGLVDVEDRLAVEIYNPNLDSWELCQPLPADFRSGNSSQWLCSALFKGKKFYVFGIYSCFITCFNLDEHLWSEVQTLRPPGILFSFLMTCQDCLVLGGLCNSPNGINFIIWKVDEETMEFSEIAIMPHELMYCLFDSDEDDKFASLKCVGLGNLIYVYNEEHHKNYPACVCEFSNEFGKCSWRKLPNLPAPASKFHRVISFCSNVSLDNILVGARI